jgi:AbrB family looped-hinge helix DNA binding protein
MTYKVGPKGQVVVPKAIRDRLGILPGDEVVIDEVDGEIRIRRKPNWDSLIGMLKGPDSMTRALEEDHRWEIEHDERRQREWSGDDRS